MNVPRQNKLGKAHINNCTQISIGDALILLLATAFGMALARYWYPHYRLEYDGWELFTLYQREVEWCLVPFAPALLVLSLRRKRSSIHATFRQDGGIASIAVIFALLAQFLNPYMWAGIWRDSPNIWIFIEGVAPDYPAYAGVFVCFGWLIRKLGFHRQKHRSYSDRLSYILGWFWISTFIVDKLYQLWLQLG